MQRTSSPPDPLICATGAPMLETHVERACRREIERRGGVFRKLTPLVVGDPDRIALLPNGRIIFVELKRPGEGPSKIQEYRHREIRSLGFEVWVVSSVEELCENLATP